MKKIVLFSLFAVALAVSPAYASRIDLVSDAGLGASVATFSDTTTTCTGCPFPYTVTIDAEVFLSGGVYSYVYDISTTATTLPVEIVTVDTDGFPNTATLNLPGFDYGVISANAADYLNLLLVTSNGNISFFFDGLTALNTPLTVYAQTDRAPGLAPFFAQDGGQASGAQTLAPVPDSGSTLAFLGLALIGVAVAQRMFIS